MEDTKPWYASTGVWGSVVAIGAGLVGTVWGINVTEADQTAIVTGVTTIVGGIGGMIALWGRLRAKTKVGK